MTYILLQRLTKQSTTKLLDDTWHSLCTVLYYVTASITHYTVTC